MIKDIEMQVAGGIEYTSAELFTFDKVGDVILAKLVAFDEEGELTNTCDGVYFAKDAFELTNEEREELGLEVEVEDE